MGTLADPTPDLLAMPRFDDGAIDMQELLRRLAEQVINAVMDAEADQPWGGGANSRNGYRERPLATCVGTLTLRIPKLRTGSFFPATRSSTTSEWTAPSPRPWPRCTPPAPARRRCSASPRRWASPGSARTR